jgi:hypothetical protein
MEAAANAMSALMGNVTPVPPTTVPVNPNPVPANADPPVEKAALVPATDDMASASGKEHVVPTDVSLAPQAPVPTDPALVRCVGSFATPWLISDVHGVI